jgi:hypothetical protein
MVFSLMRLIPESEMIEGHWQITTYAANRDNQIIAVSNSVPAGNVLFEFITVTPLGVRAAVRQLQETNMGEIYSVRLETASGDIALVNPSRTRNSEADNFTDTFTVSWRAESTIDTSEVIAIIIDGIRIPLQ